jgi:hypothetical protein
MRDALAPVFRAATASPAAMNALILAVQNISPQPRDDPKSRDRMSTMLHFEAMDHTAHSLSYLKDAAAAAAAEARAKHEVFCTTIAQRSAEFLQSLRVPAVTTASNPEGASANTANEIKAIDTTTITTMDDPPWPLTIIIMRAMPNDSMRLFGALVFAWRIQDLWAALARESAQEGGATNKKSDAARSLLLDELARVSKAAAFLVMTCEFDDSWLVSFANAMRELAQ